MTLKLNYQQYLKGSVYQTEHLLNIEHRTSHVKEGGSQHACQLYSYHLDWIVIYTNKMGDRYNIHSQLEHLQSKYIGTGHADTTKFEWMVNQHRDSFASYLGHHDLLSFFALAENESKARIRFNLMEKMLQPCGPPPEKPED